MKTPTPLPTPLKDECPTIYGPVQSRRHGLSLGINLGEPRSKACTWSCIYCQCGFGHRLQGQARPALPTVQEVVQGVADALQRFPRLDSITLAGNSEPTAHPQFAEIVTEVLRLRERADGKWIFNCLSNGSELDRDEVVAACDALDEIWVKLDCADEALFRRVNRPAPHVETVERHLERTRRLRHPRVQTLVWNSPARSELGNWTKENRSALLEAYRSLKPVQIFLTTVQRAPAMEGLEPVPMAELSLFAEEIKASGLDVRVFS